jgi:hypothetical protein
MSWPTLVKSLCLTLCVPLIAISRPEQIGKSDCKSLISHSGFAEVVVPSEGGTQEIPIKVSPAVKWTVRNSGYISWIEILDGDSGTGPGKLTIKLEKNPGRFCRVGVLTISGLTRIYGLPITILQRGDETADAKEPAPPSPPAVINLAPFSSENSEALSKREYRKVVPRR